MKAEFPQFYSGTYRTSEDGMVSLKSTHPFWMGEELT
jgi:hypothetical protein